MKDHVLPCRCLRLLPGLCWRSPLLLCSSQSYAGAPSPKQILRSNTHILSPLSLSKSRHPVAQVSEGWDGGV